jgi:uncharacterized protein YprB with RNaseH-like and TPR domain
MTDDLADRLRSLRKLGVHKGTQGVAHAPKAQALQAHELAAAGPIPGEVVDTPFGPAWLSSQRFPLAEHVELGQLLEARPEVLAAAGRDPALGALQPTRTAFIDTETTGLSMGTETYTFLIGIGTYDEDAFVVRQYFMRNPGEERAQLYLVEQALSSCSSIISFNGRAFDLPLLNTRFTLIQERLPLAGAPHLDLLPAARRIWRARLPSCALSELERSVLGVQRTTDDVPGWMIPDIYRDYYRTGGAADLIAHVFYHNLVDITSMARLAGRLARLFEISHLEQHVAELHPLDCLSLARCYGAVEWYEAGETAYRAALRQAAAAAERVLVFRELSFFLKRLERRAEAAALWEEWIGTVAGDDLTPYIELAKYHEWHTLDLAAARGWTAWAIHSIQHWPPGYAREEMLAALQHRLLRLERKLAGVEADRPGEGDRNQQDAAVEKIED